MKKGEKLITVSPLGIVHIEKHSDYELMSMRKEELVKYIRMLESNYECLNIQYENAVPAKHGHWIVELENDDGRSLRCSNCLMVFWVGHGRDGNYCPNCGSKMDEEKENDQGLRHIYCE
ncbi:MAG: hypothetical protein K6C34_00935 [Alphaproteobacteria bacterium]|nr:hypothetical protein [Alphaproteobacteria bacterium]